MGDLEEFNVIKNIFNKTNQVFDSLCMNFKFQNGVVGSGQWLYNCKTELDRIEIIGDNGIIRFDFFHNNSPVCVITEAGQSEYVIEDSQFVGLNMEQEIVNELNGIGKFSGDVSAALKTLKITAEILKQKL